MPRWYSRPALVMCALYAATLLSIVLAAVQAVQIPLGALPEDSRRLTLAPIWHFMHVTGGVMFGMIGPIQFGRVLAGRYGRLHRVMGRVFVVAGAAISLSALSLLWHFPTAYSPIISGGRLVFGVALGGALVVAMRAAVKRDIAAHRDWMIRAYAVGVGATVVSVVFFPIYIVTGRPPTGMVADIAFIGAWTACIAVAEIVVRRICPSRA